MPFTQVRQGIVILMVILKGNCKHSFLDFAELAHVEIMIKTFVCQETSMVALLNNLAIFQYQNFICFLNSR